MRSGVPSPLKVRRRGSEEGFRPGIAPKGWPEVLVEIHRA